jgi:hypothetical protein
MTAHYPPIHDTPSQAASERSLLAPLEGRAMAESKSTPKKLRRPEGATDRQAANDRHERQNYTAGATGEQQVSLDGQLGPDEISDPEEVVRNNEAKAHDEPPAHGVESRPDHSERTIAGDQDIDTAGMIPGNKATDTP